LLPGTGVVIFSASFNDTSWLREMEYFSFVQQPVPLLLLLLLLPLPLLLLVMVVVLLLVLVLVSQSRTTSMRTTPIKC